MNNCDKCKETKRLQEEMKKPPEDRGFENNGEEYNKKYGNLTKD